MPAASESSGAPALPHTWRPLGPRIAGIVAGSSLVVVTSVLWFVAFDQETRDAVTPFQRGTVAAMGLLMFACLYALVRSRVVADDSGLVVVNGYRRHELEWAEVIAVRLPPGAPWVTLDLADGETVAAMGIQGSDGARAKAAVRDLRVLLQRTDPPAD